MMITRSTEKHVMQYYDGMTYREFCDLNPKLETRKEWDETTSEAMDAYYECKEYVDKMKAEETMAQ